MACLHQPVQETPPPPPSNHSYDSELLDKNFKAAIVSYLKACATCLSNMHESLCSLLEGGT
jgi:hypothetical protein